MRNILKLLLSKHVLDDLCEIVVSYSYKHITQYASLKVETERHYPKWQRKESNIKFFKVIQLQNRYILWTMAPNFHARYHEITEADFEDVSDYLSRHIAGYPEIDIDVRMK